MRRVVDVLDEGEEELVSTVRPVLLGDSGEAMIGAGNVRRFRYVGVMNRSVPSFGGGTGGRGSKVRELAVMLGGS
jgi:hypothetical protein